MPQSWHVRYAIDARDTIDFVNEDWDAFALHNAGASIVRSRVLGRSIWDFMDDAPTEEFYRMLFDRVRDGRSNIQFGFRCDSDTERRFLRMEIACANERRIDFSVTPIAVETRPSSKLFSDRADRSDQLVSVCSWCKRVRCSDGSWREIEQAMPLIQPFRGNEVPSITHGMCADCLAIELRVLNEHSGNDDRLIAFGEFDVPALVELRSVDGDRPNP